MEDKRYKNFGIRLLIASIIILLIDLVPILIALLDWSFFHSFVLEVWGGLSLYRKILGILSLAEIIIFLWLIIISIILIKINKYTKQLPYIIYTYLIYNIIRFILHIPVKRYLVIELLIAILLYIFLIKKDNKLSRLIKNK